MELMELLLNKFHPIHIISRIALHCYGVLNLPITFIAAAGHAVLLNRR